MSADPTAALARQRQREADRKRRQHCQREDLRHAARLLIPDQGLSVPLAQIATEVGLSRRVAAGLFHSVADLAVHLVCHTWRGLIETTAPRPGDTPEEFCARLIQALRAEAATHRVWQAIQCGLPPRHRQTVAHEEAFLAYAIGEALRELRPAPTEHSAEIGGQLLALARHAAYAPAAPDARVEAARLAAILPLLAPAAAAAPAPPARRSPAKPAVNRPRQGTQAPPPAAVPVPSAPPGLPAVPGHPPPWAAPARHGRDPPVRAA